MGTRAVMSVFIDMDEMVGGQFEEGLTNLKAVAEKEAASAASETALQVDPAASRL